LKKNYSVKTIALLSISLLLVSSFAIVALKTTYAQTPSAMTFTTGETMSFTTNEEMTFKSPTAMQFWSGVKMLFGTNVTAHFIELTPNGYIEPCDMLQIIWPAGYMPYPCSWWEIIDPVTGKATGFEFHLDQGGPDVFHVDMIYNPTGGPIPYSALPIVAVKKVDIIEPCQYYEVHWPSGWYPQPCTWWELIDPETGLLTGVEFHVDWTNESCEFHIDQVLVQGQPGFYMLPFPWYEVWARMKIPGIKPCDYLVVEEPLGWYPAPCTWWEVMDPHTGEATGAEFHVDWTNESCEFHIDQVLVQGTPGPYVFEPYPVPFVIAEQKIVNITRCDWYVVVDPAGFLPQPCTLWEILDASGAPTGLEFHVDSTDGITMFHVDNTSPDIIIHIPPSYTVTVKKKIDTVTQCSWFKVDDPTSTPEVCSWWEILDPITGEPTGWEFHVDANIPADGLFHVDIAEPGPSGIPIAYMLTAEKKITNMQPCDWFKVIDPTSWIPQPCSWWKIVMPAEWSDIIFHVDQAAGGRFHVDYVNAQLPPLTIPPWNVTAEPYTPSEPWYIKSPYPDYALSGMPDFDEKQDNWGPAPGIFTWCGPVSVANSLWWLDSEYESIMNPAPVPPPTISDSFNLVASYKPGVWDDHDAQNVDPLVANLAFLMDTDGMQSGDGHTGTRWTDMASGINQYLIQQGVAGTFEVHSAEFPEFEWVESEIMKCQDVVLFLEFFQDQQGMWMPLYDNPSLESGHYVTCAGVNSTTFQLLISDPIQDAFEKGATFGRSPWPHPYPHASDVHNDTKYVSHDGYSVNLWAAPPYPYPSPYGGPVWELVGYLQALGYDPTWHAFIRAAVVTSPLAVHDIAVKNLTACYGATVIHGGEICYINVTAENQGTVAETFTLTVYWNTTHVINSTSVSLTSGTTAIVPFKWNTSGLTEYDNYTLSAYATPVPGEIDTADNNYVDGTVVLVHLGDVDNNHKVEIKDIFAIAKAYGSSVGQPKYNSNLDINNDGKIDIKDIFATAKNFGWHD
jgi:hypothetical protein